MTSTFPLGTLITAASRENVIVGDAPADRLLHDLYRLAHHMTGAIVTTHELPTVFSIARPRLLAQFPWLREYVELIPLRDPETGMHATQEAIVVWYRQQTAKHGETFEVEGVGHE
jgi:hypothetical protein